MPSTNFSHLPPEIVNHIVERIDDLGTITNLSLISRRFRDYVLQDGYRIFVLQHYPAYQRTDTWLSAAQYLTALSRAWRRKSFLARNLRPPTHGSEVLHFPENIHDAASFPRNGRQSMGYQPVIDCFETWSSGKRSEILTWGAGAEIILRIKNEFTRPRSVSVSALPPEAKALDGDLQWIIHKSTDMIDGRDDITVTKLLLPHQFQDDAEHHVIVGRASGHLQHLSFNKEGVKIEDIGSENGSIDCADTNKSSDPIVAVCRNNKKISLHRVHDSTSDITSFEFDDHKKSDVIWTTRFLSDTLLAVGQGSTKRPLSLLQLTPEGIVDLNFPKVPYNVSDAIYAIEPLHDTKYLFLTGHYSGHVQLNDMRIPNGRAAVYDDPVDCSPMYSLLPMVGPRFVAGGARHCLLKFFDMRRPNWSCSSYTADPEYTSRVGYNIFLPTIGTRMTKTSPTYCLTASNPHAGSFYAGIENGVVQIDLHSAHDPLARPNGDIPLLDRSTADSIQLENETESLRLVEHSTDGVPVLLRQTNLTHQERRRKVILDYDDRWAEDFGYDSDASVRRMGRNGRGTGIMQRRRFS